MTPHEAYLEFLGQLRETLDQLTDIEKEKTDAVRRDDLAGVNDCMKREQALSLTLRSMDAKRTKLLAEMGLENVKLRDFAATCPQELRQRAVRATEQLQNSYAVYRSAADLARNTLERSLRQIDDYLASQTADAPIRDGGIRDFKA